MQKYKSGFRRPTPDEQTVLREIAFKLLVKAEQAADGEAMALMPSSA